MKTFLSIFSLLTLGLTIPTILYGVEIEVLSSEDEETEEVMPEAEFVPSPEALTQIQSLLQFIESSGLPEAEKRSLRPLLRNIEQRIRDGVGAEEVRGLFEELQHRVRHGGVYQSLGASE